MARAQRPFAPLRAGSTCGCVRVCVYACVCVASIGWCVCVCVVCVRVVRACGV